MPEGGADRAGGPPRCTGSGDQGRGLGQAVALVDGYARAPAEGVDHSLASGAEPDSTIRTDPSRSARSSMGNQAAKTGGADRDHADRLVLDQVEGAGRLEALAEHQPGALAQVTTPSTALRP